MFNLIPLGILMAAQSIQIHIIFLDHPIHEHPLFSALGEIESNNVDYRVGRSGELGRFQITRVVWEQWDKVHKFHHYATNPAIAVVVASKQLDWLNTAYRKVNHKSPTPFDLYIMWNKGYYYYKQHDFSGWKLPEKIRQRGEKFSSILLQKENKN